MNIFIGDVMSILHLISCKIIPIELQQFIDNSDFIEANYDDS